MDQQEVLNRVENSIIPEDLFGKNYKDVGPTFRAYAKLINADANPHLSSAYRKLLELHEQAKEKERNGHYGNIRIIPSFDIKFQKTIYHINEFFCDGDVSSIYGTDNNFILKIALDKDNNNFLEHEKKILEKISPDPTYSKYLPKFITSFQVDKKTINVFNRISNHITLCELLISAKKSSISYDFKDMAWIVKRLLEGIGYIHSQGLVHGSIIPEHILLDPVSHGAKIIDWCWSQSNGKLEAISSNRKEFYPPEVFSKQIIRPQSDIFMIAKCAIFILGGNVQTNELPNSVPVEISNFLKSCLIANPSRRPDSAWNVYEDFSKILKSLVGPPKFKNLEISTTANFS